MLYLAPLQSYKGDNDYWFVPPCPHHTTTTKTVRALSNDRQQILNNYYFLKFYQNENNFKNNFPLPPKTSPSSDSEASMILQFFLLNFTLSSNSHRNKLLYIYSLKLLQLPFNSSKLPKAP